MSLEITNKINNVINALTNLGYETKTDKVSKNGMEKEGLLIKKQNGIWAVFYIEVLERMQEEEIIAYIKKELENQLFDPDMNLLTDREYLLEHMYIGLQRESDIPLVSRKSPFDGIVEYLYVLYEGTGTINLSENVFEEITKDKYTKEDVWNIALKHTCEDAVIGDIQEMMYEDLGIPSETEDITTPMCVITSKSRIRGAAAVLNKEIIKKYTDAFGLEEFYLIPSSIHEVIVIPCIMPKEEADKMVIDANTEVVSDDIKLGDEAFLVKAKDYIA